MTWLVDTNILVYRFDPRFPKKQRRATEVLRRGLVSGSTRIPHQAIVEFVAATTRPTKKGGRPLLSLDDAREEAEGFLNQFTVLYPTEELVRLALRGSAAYRLSWFDAHLWAYAEYYGLSEIVTEDFQPQRVYGSVRIRNPFLEKQREGSRFLEISSRGRPEKSTTAQERAANLHRQGPPSLDPLDPHALETPNDGVALLD